MELLLGTLALRWYVFAFLGMAIGAALFDVGWRRTLLFVACVWPLAWLAEFSSTRIGVPFGFYRYTGLTRGQELFLADVPFMDSVSFVFLAYAAFCLGRLAFGRRDRLTQAMGTGALMMLLDVVIDPAAVRGDRWFLGPVFYYPDGGVYFGVPLSNFAGWWTVGTAAVGWYLLLAGDGSGRRAWPGVALYYAVLGFNLAVTAWIGEWKILVVGLTIHAVAASGLMAISRGAKRRRRLGRRRAQSV